MHHMKAPPIFNNRLFSAKKVGGIFFLLFYFLSTITLLYAQEAPQGSERVNEAPRFELGEIIVSAARIEEPLRNVPRNVSVITSEDIKQATSNNVVDLLTRESGLTLRSLFGHDKKAKIDIRGMGDASVSNVIVMVDGVRLTPPDMAGPDFSSIPLDQIDRIEIIRGSGSVIYGDGAVGGVINIITRKVPTASKFRLVSSSGSYHTKDLRAYWCRIINKLNFTVNADYYDSEGYRDNGDIRKKDVSLHSTYPVSDSITLNAQASYHNDTYGLPGAIEKKYAYNKDLRKMATTANDGGETTNRRYEGGIEINLDTWGTIKTHRGYRLRDNSYIMGFNDLRLPEDQTDSIDEHTQNFYLTYYIDYTLGGLEHRFHCGFDQYDTEYVREELSKNYRKNSRVKNRGAFVTHDWALMKDLMFHLGYRQNVYEHRSRQDEHEHINSAPPVKRWINGESSNNKWTNDAYDTGIVCSFGPNIRLFTSLANSFRIPNVDELTLGEEGLHPQEGLHFDLGGSYKIKGIMEYAATLFHITTKDEIYFGKPLNGDGESLNRNFDEETERKGIETDIKIYPVNPLYIWGNYTYTEARFIKGGDFIPLVPKHKASIGIEWQVCYPLLLSLTGTMVSSCFDGNDWENIKEKLKGYEVVDAKLTYTYKEWSVFFGVNNILNEYYSTISYHEKYYPMPGRNFGGGIQWNF